MDATLEILGKSAPLDPVGYGRASPDLHDKPEDVVDRYLELDARERRNRYPLFDASFYLERNPDVATSGMHPLTHYLAYGAAEGRDPHPLFDTTFYLEKNPDVAASGVNPLAHYMLFGGREGCSPHPLFDSRWYLEQCRDAETARWNPLLDYIQSGWQERREPHPLFDSKWYLKQYPDVELVGTNPLLHYLQSGWQERRKPHPLFDSKWYLEQYPDVELAGVNPLLHYVRSGWQERRNPHPLFDATWYLNRHPDVAQAGIDPLRHYLTSGWTEDRNPGPFFNTAWYRSKYGSADQDGECPLCSYLSRSRPNLQRPHPLFDPAWYYAKYGRDIPFDLNPFVDYVANGIEAGRLPMPHFERALDYYTDGVRTHLDLARHAFEEAFLARNALEGKRAAIADAQTGRVTDTEIQCLKTPSYSGEAALFVTHSPHGRLKPHVRHYLDCLKRRGVAVVLIVAADGPFSSDPDLADNVDGIFVRRNEGYDFAAWAHILHLHPELLDATILYLLNDSLIGPINDDLFGSVLEKIRNSTTDLLGLTDNYELGWHIQSYFLAIKPPALSSAAFREFIGGIVSYRDKNRVIEEYEVPLARTLIAAGLKCEAVFKSNEEAINYTIYKWNSLIDAGFPFIKVTTIRDTISDLDISDWRETLAVGGFDVSIAERTLAEARAATHALRRDGEFDPEFYLAIYPDVAAAGIDAYDHYSKYGRAEGRLPRTTALDALDHFGSAARVAETVLVVSHEGVRGGAPILCYNLVKRLLEKYNVIILFLGDGPILDACRDIGAVVVGPISLSGSKPLADLVVKRISEAAPIKFAIANTILSRFVLPGLSKRYIPSISLIHEFAAYVRPNHAFRETVLWSGQTVFSTEITRDNALTDCPELSAGRYPVIPQGLTIVPKDEGAKDQARDDERSRIRRLLRPTGFPEDGVVILGAGYVEFRKGVDIFIACAASVVRGAPDLRCRFAWMGRGFDPDRDVAYSVFLVDQVRRSGLEKHVFFLGEVYDVSAVYELSDLFVLSSRLDPLPNVAVEALAAGLPVICFDNTTGIANILDHHDLRSHTVSSYMDTQDMAQKVISLARSKELRGKVAAQCARLAGATFNMARYIERIEHIAAQQADCTKQEQIDVETIAQSDLPRFEYHLLPNERNQDRADVIRRYVRSWSSGIGKRKLFPGFHPGIYLERHGVERSSADPLADYLRAGRPPGPWNFPLLTPRDAPKPLPSNVRIGLHIHAYYVDIVPEILRRLKQNRVRPDLLISVADQSAQETLQRQLADFDSGKVTIHLVPNRGRDIGPFLTEFGETMLKEYDLIGHLHTKKTSDYAHKAVGERWYYFLLEHLLGDRAPMADIILSEMIAQPNIGIVFPDDPHIIGWDRNKPFVAPYFSALSLQNCPENLNFPVGTMFWARPRAIKALIDLGLTWQDYPAEPAPYDGSILHGLERIFGLVVNQAGFDVVNTSVDGVTR